MLDLIVALILHAASLDPGSGVCRYDYVADGVVVEAHYATCGLTYADSFGGAS